jgi:hypothetical protein
MKLSDYLYIEIRKITNTIKQNTIMITIILFILLWASNLAVWAKALLTALWVLGDFCEAVNTSSQTKKDNAPKAKKRAKKEVI